MKNWFKACIPLYFIAFVGAIVGTLVWIFGQKVGFTLTFILIGFFFTLGMIWALKKQLDVGDIHVPIKSSENKLNG